MPDDERYLIESELGRGALGVVYLAQDTRLGRRVALKSYAVSQGLPAERREEYRERFRREARAAAALSHPGIVTVYDVDEGADGRPTIAMEYVPGKSLREALVEQGRFAPERAFTVALALADALDAAHRAGVVHRDVKPANVMVRDVDGLVKIADFGVARLAGSELTRSGDSIGSPAYMAPEQIRGLTIDGRADLFSLAVILYELLCGERPFTGDDLATLAYAIVHETPVPIGKRMPGLPAGLDAFFDRALAKDPAHRFTSGAAFREGLEQARRAGPADGAAVTVVATRLPERASSGRRRFVVAAAVLGLLALTVWVVVIQRAAYLKLDGKSSVIAGDLTLTIDGEPVYSRRLSREPTSGGLLKKVFRGNQESFEAWIRVRPGKHEVAARVAVDADYTHHEDTIVLDLEPGETRRLRIVAGRSLGNPLSLRAD